MMGILIAIAVVLLIAGILVIIYFVRNRRFFRASLQKLESQAESRKQKDASAKDTVMA